jgi:hypothetical protein
MESAATEGTEGVETLKQRGRDCVTVCPKAGCSIAHDAVEPRACHWLIGRRRTACRELLPTVLSAWSGVGQMAA